MDSSPSGSFIPKRSANKPARAQLGKRVYLFGYVAYVFFFGALLGVLGIFVLNLQAEKKLQETILLVEEAQSQFNRDQIASLTDLDERIKLVETMLDQHAMVSVIFTQIESFIVSSVRALNFDYMREAENTAMLSIGVAASNFDEVLFQRQVLQANTPLSGAVIKEVTYGAEAEGGTGATEKGSIDFLIENEFRISDIAYTGTTQASTPPALGGTSSSAVSDAPDSVDGGRDRTVTDSQAIIFEETDAEALPN